MLKKIIPYIIVIIMSFIISFFIFTRINSDIKNRLSELITITTALRDNQQKANESITRITNTINEIGGVLNIISRGIEKSEARSDRIEIGIEKLERINNDSIQKLQLLITGNESIEESNKEFGNINNEFKGILESIRERNKEVIE
ncbi:MAG: hypothetical protein PHS93_09475 [Candidatus Omnitrophica bacterium]|nr:hypothetical protein [Candidatus Omnitrophota bacterium]